eukprot:9722375-Heterocapsa_arctica.AAC.1
MPEGETEPNNIPADQAGQYADNNPEGTEAEAFGEGGLGPQLRETGTNLHDTDVYRLMTSKKETAKPAILRTYVDDWRLFKSGDQKAACTLVTSLVTT